MMARGRQGCRKFLFNELENQRSIAQIRKRSGSNIHGDMYIQCVMSECCLTQFVSPIVRDEQDSPVFRATLRIVAQSLNGQVPDQPAVTANNVLAVIARSIFRICNLLWLFDRLDRRNSIAKTAV